MSCLLYLQVNNVICCVFLFCFCLDCDKTDVVFVQNATTGTNSVIQSLVKTLNKGDEVLMTNFTYGKDHQSRIVC